MQIHHLKTLFQAYKKTKKVAKPFKGVVTKADGRRVISRIQQEMVILETNLAKYMGISRRVRPSVLENVNSKQLKTDMDAAIKMYQTYIRDYQKVYDAWEKYAKGSGKKKVTLPVYPTSFLPNNTMTNSLSGKRFADALNEYMQSIKAWYRDTHGSNAPIDPYEKNLYNVRHLMINELPNVKKTKKLNFVQLSLIRNLKADVQQKTNALQKKTNLIANVLKELDYFEKVAQEMKKKDAMIIRLKEEIQSLRKR